MQLFQFKNDSLPDIYIYRSSELLESYLTYYIHYTKQTSTRSRGTMLLPVALDNVKMNKVFQDAE